MTAPDAVRGMKSNVGITTRDPCPLFSSSKLRPELCVSPFRAMNFDV